MLARMLPGALMRSPVPAPGSGRSAPAYGAQRGKPDLDDLLRALPRVQHGAAVALAVGFDRIVDRGVDAGMAQSGDDEVAFPGAVVRLRPMLDRTMAVSCPAFAGQGKVLRS